MKKIILSLFVYLLSIVPHLSAVQGNAIAAFNEDSKHSQLLSDRKNWLAFPNKVIIYDDKDPLSNFYERSIVIGGIAWPSVEHYYQAQKFAYYFKFKTHIVPKFLQVTSPHQAITL